MSRYESDLILVLLSLHPNDEDDEDQPANALLGKHKPGRHSSAFPSASESGSHHLAFISTRRGTST